MIKLKRAPKPAYLTEDKISELTAEFKSIGSSVWNNHHIKAPLLASSNGKCAYCECPLETESNYMEVEHFVDKSSSPDQVVDWDNLLPSCKKCNAAKGKHDVLAEPIVNPYRDEPRDHLAFRLYRLKGLTEVGESTIQVTNLNHPDRLVFVRFKIGEKIGQLIETSLDRWKNYELNPNTKSRNKLVGIIEGLLKECAPNSSYAASTATILLTDRTFLILIETMKARLLWTEELEESLQAAISLALEQA